MGEPDYPALVEQLRACGRRIPKDGFTMSIPARPEHDADLLLMRAADAIEVLLGEIEHAATRDARDNEVLERAFKETADIAYHEGYIVGRGDIDA